MSTIVTRAGKGSPLTNTEVDANFTNLNTDKQEILAEGAFVDGDKTKLDGIESGATTDQTAAEIRTLVESATDSNVFTDADHTKLNGIAASATANPNALDNISEDTTPELGGNLDVNGNQIHLDQTSGVAIRTTGDLSNGDLTLLRASSQNSADGDYGFDVKYIGSRSGNANSFALEMHNQNGTHVEAITVYQDGKVGINKTAPTERLDVTGNIAVSGTVDGRDIATDGTKLDGIEASADVTDTTNVTAAGALMDSEVTNLAQVKAFDSSDYATAAQGTTADSALQNISEDTSPQLGGNLDTNGYGITLNDAAHEVTENHILLGNDGDLDIYHADTASVIGNNTGDLYITNISNDADVNISTKKFGNSGSTLAFVADGSTGESILYHDGAQKIATKSTGIQTTGTVSVNGAYTLPTSDGTNGQVLTTDGSGAVTFQDASGGGSSLTIKDEGSALSTAATTINFTGSGVTATGTGAEKTVNIPSVAKYTEFDLAPGATSVTLTLSGDSDVQKVEFRLAAKTTSSGPNNPTFTVKTSGGTNHRWDIQGMRMYNYTDTSSGLHVDGTTDIYSFLSFYNDFSTPTVFTFYKSEGNRWTCEATIAAGNGTTGTSYVLHCRTDFGYSYSDIGSFVFATGSSYNWTTFDGTIVEYFK